MKFEQIYQILHFSKEKKPTLNEALHFINQSVVGDVPLYLAGNAFFVYTILVPSSELKTDYVADLMQWNFGVPRGWGYGYSLHSDYKDVEFFISPPLDQTGSRILGMGEATFFWRDFVGVGSYIELNQKIAQVLDIHLVLEDKQRLYQRINENGDYKNIAIAYHDEFMLCTLRDADLEIFTFLTESVAIRVFDVLLTAGEHLAKFDKIITKKTTNGDVISYNGGPLRGVDGSYIRGFQVLNLKMDQKDLVKLVRGESERKYATFLTLDWRNEKIHECSCNPNQLGNYFVESDLPFEISPVFFRPEVMHKYQQNPDKYLIEPRRIYLYGVWQIRYDINEKGQVHVYLKDLASIPYNEQLYWKSFNEEPKTGISPRALAQDFEGKWVTFEDPLIILRQILTEFPPVEIGGNPQTIWEGHADSFNRLNYVLTDSRKEWEEQILNLAKLLVDGLNKKTITKIAKALICHDPNLGSIKLLSHCLLTYGTDQAVVDDIVNLLGELWATRNTIAHPGQVTNIKYKDHFKKLLERSAENMEVFSNIIRDGFPSI